MHKLHATSWTVIDVPINTGSGLYSLIFPEKCAYCFRPDTVNHTSNGISEYKESIGETCITRKFAARLSIPYCKEHIFSLRVMNTCNYIILFGASFIGILIVLYFFFMEEDWTAKARIIGFPIMIFAGVIISLLPALIVRGLFFKLCGCFSEKWRHYRISNGGNLGTSFKINLFQNQLDLK